MERPKTLMEQGCPPLVEHTLREWITYYETRWNEKRLEDPQDLETMDEMLVLRQMKIGIERALG